MLKTAVVTGASSGMGKETAAQLAASGMKVYMVVRNEERGKEALEYVRLTSGRNDAELVLCDLASLVSVHACAAVLKERCERIDVLINNAGLITTKRQESADGFEMQIAVNHLAHFVLTGLLLKQIEQSEEGRIINVSSAAHKIGRMNWDDPWMKETFTIWGAYGRSKLANLWFTVELADRLKGTTVTVNSVHPGAVSTQFGVNRSTNFGGAVHKLLRPFFLTAQEGSATAIYLACAAEVQGVSGQYFYRKKPIAMSKRAQDRALSRRFWQWSEEVTGFILKTDNDSIDDNGKRMHRVRGENERKQGDT